MAEVRFAIGVQAGGTIWTARLSLNGWTGPSLSAHPRVMSDEQGEYVIGYGTRIEAAVEDAIAALGKVCLECAFRH